MTRNRSNFKPRLLRFLSPLLLFAAASACATADVVHFTSEVYPEKRSAGDVKILDGKPDRPHERIAQITIADSTKKNATLQRLIREKAAELGADAILFSDPEHYYDNSVQYAPVYQPWGYYAPSYGWYGGSYVAGVPVSHKTRRNTLSGVAIRFTGTSD